MDFFIVAAATGAGYAAKYWKQSKDEEAYSQLSFGESSLVSSQSSNHPLNNFTLRKKRCEHVFGDGTMEESCSNQSLASMSGFENEKLQLFVGQQDFNVLSRPIMTWKSWMDENFEEQIEESRKRNNKFLVCNASGRNRSRGKAIFSNGDLIKPVSFEEDKLPKGSHFDDAESFCGFSQLPFKYLQMCDMVSDKTGNGGESRSKSCSKMAKGAPNESFILYLGVFIGMIHSFISNKREILKLKELLKETQYLVQDLQEEIETKDAFNLKELSNDNCESYTCSIAFPDKTGEESLNHDMNYTVNFYAEELYEQKRECAKSISRIEAELEAELEMLGLDINAEATETLSDEDEIDAEFEKDFAEGESRNETNSGESSGWAKPKEEGSNSTVHSGNYMVSPWELSLRLQNVIQSRLEGRIKMLEIALKNNNRKLLLVEAENRSSWHELVNGEDESNIAIQPL